MREPFHPIPRVVPRAVTAEAAVGLVRNGDTVFVHTGCAAPHALMTALAARGVGGGVRDVTVVHNFADAPSALLTPEATAVFRHKMHFVGSGARAAVAEGRADYVPLAFGELPWLIRRGVQRVDVALINVSPPDNNGFCTLGISVDVRAAARPCACVCARLGLHLCACVPMCQGWGGGVVIVAVPRRWVAVGWVGLGWVRVWVWVKFGFGLVLASRPC